MNTIEDVILVNTLDEQIGVMEKLEAHAKGLLHRAFSVLLFNDKGELLLQQRASEKYHCAELWTNTCCSHPRVNESLEAAVERRLLEEMGIRCETKKLFEFIYHAELPNNLIEHEYDHVYVGVFNGIPEINLSEVKDWKFQALDSIKLDVEQNGDDYTPWFKIILDKITEAHIPTSNEKIPTV